MKLILFLIFLLVAPALAVNFPFAPLGDCFDGTQKLMKYYPNAQIAYNSTLENGRGHVWLIQGNIDIDSYWGEMQQGEYLQPEKTFDNWEDFENSLKIRC